MQRVRSAIVRHPVLLAVLLFCALAARALIPTGYMPTAVGGTITLTLCAGTAPARTMEMHEARSMAGMHHGKADHDPGPTAEQPCAYAALAGPALASAAPAMLAAALAYTFLLALLPTRLILPARPARLRPPLRAPPVFA